MSDTPGVDSRKSGESEATKLARKWNDQLDLAARENKDFIDGGRKVVKRYKNERDSKREKGKRFNILYSNTETLQADLYGRTAKPDVRRRFSDRDPVGQAAAEVIERTLTYFDDVDNVDSPIEAALQDYLLPGRGTIRIEYEPIIGQQPAIDPVTGAPQMMLDDDGAETGDPEMMDFIADQKIRHRYVYWEDILVAPARRFSEVPWIAFRHNMTREDLEEEIFENAPPTSKVWGNAADIPLNWTSDDPRSKEPKGDLKRAEVFEIWNKAGTERIWIAKGAPAAMRLDVDPYEIEGFWPFPEPLASYRANDTMTPQAEFETYRDQADDLDEITRRISILTKAMRRRGVYNQAIPELKRLANASDNEYIPSPNYKTLATSGGLAENFLTEDIAPIAAVLVQLYQQRDMLVQAIYEITGIADIRRGVSDPDETLGAQQMKAQFGSQRMRRRQRAVQRWIRDLNRIKVDLICRHFEPEVLQQIADVQVTPDIMQVLRSDAMRCYRIDIETDSTNFPNAQEDQQQRTQFVTAMTQFVAAWAPIIQGQPALIPLCFAALNFAVQAFPDARQMQDVIDETEQALQQAGQQPKPDPKLQADQAKAQQTAVEGQTKVAVAQINAQAEGAKAQAETQRAVIDLQTQRESAALDQQRAQQKHDLEMQHMAERHAADMQRRNLDQDQFRRAGVPA